MMLGINTTVAQQEFLVQSESTDAACEHSSVWCSATLNSPLFPCTVFIVFKGLNMTLHLSSSAFSLLLA